MKKVEKRYGKKTFSVIITVLLLLCTALCFIVAVQAAVKKEVSIFGYRFYYVTTGSMEPTIPVGAVIAVHKPGRMYKTGDIISFKSKDSSIYGRVNTHRIIGIQDSGGEARYITKGDANSTADEMPVNEADIIGEVVWSSGYIPAVYAVIEFLGTRFGFVLCVLLPVLLITACSIKDFSREYRSEMRRIRAEVYSKEAGMVNPDNKQHEKD